MLRQSHVFLNQKRMNVCDHMVKIDWETHRDRQNVSIKLLCVCVCLSPRDLSSFWWELPLSFPIFCVINELNYIKKPSIEGSKGLQSKLYHFKIARERTVHIQGLEILVKVQKEGLLPEKRAMRPADWQ